MYWSILFNVKDTALMLRPLETEMCSRKVWSSRRHFRVFVSTLLPRDCDKIIELAALFQNLASKSWQRPF